MNFLIQKQKNNPHYSKILLLGLIFLFSFFFSKNAHAYVAAQQLTKDTASTQTISNHDQGLGPLSGTLSDISVNLSTTGTSATSSVYLVLFCYTNTNYNVNVDCFTGSTSTNNQATSSIQTITGNTASNYNFSFTGTSSINLARTGIGALLLSIRVITGQAITAYGSNSSSSYVNGINAICFASCGSLQDYYFILNASGTIPSAVYLTYPQASTTQDFDSWIVQASGQIAKIKINYSDNVSNYSDTAGIYSTANGYTYFQIPKTHVLGISTSTLYSATPYILDTNDNIVASGTTIFFQITSTNSTTTTSNFQTYVQSLLNGGLVGLNTFGIPFPSATSTQNCTWNSPLDCVTNAITQMIYGAFTPHDISLSLIKNQMTQFQSIFPFSVPLTLMAQLENDASTTPTYTALSITVPGVNNLSVDFLTSSSVSSTLGSNTASTWFTINRTLLYAGTGLIMFFAIL